MHIGELSPQAQGAAAAVPFLVASDRQQLLDVLLATPEGKSHDSSTQAKGVILGLLLGAGVAYGYFKIIKKR